MTTDFYRQFEDHFRGSRADIKDRLAFYRPFLTCLRANVDQHSALDLGCGRGEWLETLVEVGFDAHGVDLDQGMLEACHQLGLSAKRGDALQTLESCQDNSLALVSALHVIEHIPFDQLIELVKQAHRVLAPGGLLILETPNSENLYSATTSFYLDPTHSKPIPQALLSFVVEFAGFRTHKTMGLNEAQAQAHGASISLTNVLFGASPDYAVIAIKASDTAHTAPYQALLAHQHGLSLLELAKQYDQRHSTSAQVTRLEQGLGIISDRFFAAECKLDDTHDLAERHLQEIARQQKTSEQQLSALTLVEEKVSQLNALLQRLQCEIERNHQEIQKTHQIQAGLVGRIDSMHASTSWRITRPLRAVSRIAQSVRHHGLKGLVMPIAEYARSSPTRRASTAKWLRRLGLRKAAARLTHQEPEE